MIFFFFLRFLLRYAYLVAVCLFLLLVSVRVCFCQSLFKSILYWVVNLSFSNQVNIDINENDKILYKKMKVSVKSKSDSDTKIYKRMQQNEKTPAIYTLSSPPLPPKLPGSCLPVK